MTNLVDLCRPGSHGELAVIRATLEANGIEHMVINEFGGLGLSGAFATDEMIVRVRQEDLATAQAVLRP